MTTTGRPTPTYPMAQCLDGRHPPFNLEEHPEGCPVHVRARVECDADCGALDQPMTESELRAALEHWRGHGHLLGCAHGR